MGKNFIPYVLPHYSLYYLNQAIFINTFIKNIFLLFVLIKRCRFFPLIILKCPIANNPVSVFLPIKHERTVRKAMVRNVLGRI